MEGVFDMYPLESGGYLMLNMMFGVVIYVDNSHTAPHILITNYSDEL